MMGCQQLALERLTPFTVTVRRLRCLSGWARLCLLLIGSAQSPCAVLRAATTSLSDPSIRYVVPHEHYVILRRGDTEAIVADNHAIDDHRLRGHRAGYSGLAALKHTLRQDNLFVERYAGLNFEHIHDGRTLPREVVFEPRNVAMQLRQIDPFAVELYQAPTPNWELESCHRYQLLPDGTIELTVEWIPRGATFANGYVGLFWASYIHQPESGDIFFRGVTRVGNDQTEWVRASSPQHGVKAAHRHIADDRVWPHDDDFPLTLVFNESPHRHTEHWYYGVSHQMAWIVMFRPMDRVRFAQSPSGGGDGNPAWDFQTFVSPYQIDRVYRMVMRAMYIPFESPEQVERVSRRHREALQQQE